jgi:hypothetical protein
MALQEQTYGGATTRDRAAEAEEVAETLRAQAQSMGAGHTSRGSRDHGAGRVARRRRLSRDRGGRERANRAGADRFTAARRRTQRRCRLR